MPIYHEPIYQQIHLLSVYFSKLIDNRTQARLRLRGFIRLVFPELLKCFDIETVTCLYLLKKYMMPDDFLKLDIEKESSAIMKISISQHGCETLEKIKKYAGESIGVNTASMYQQMRLILTSMIDTFEFIRNQTNIILFSRKKL